MSVQEDYCSGKPGIRHSDEYYTGAQCKVCGYHPQPPKGGRPLRYPELDGAISLFNKGREMLGSLLYATEKRDGSNIHFWLKDGEVRITSRNGPTECLECGFSSVGDDNIKIHKEKTGHSKTRGDSIEKGLRERIPKLKEFKSIQLMLKENPSWNIFCEYVPDGRGPTKIEPAHKIATLTLFDIAIPAKENNFYKNRGFEFFPYRYLHQQAIHYRIPVVKLYGEGEFATMETYEKWVVDLLKYSRRHKREGVVIKKYTKPQIFIKEKVDLPKRAPIQHFDVTSPILPPLPESEIFGAIDKVFADNGMDFMRDKSKAMPEIVKYVRLEAQKHQMNMPTGALFKYYTDFMIARDRQDNGSGVRAEKPNDGQENSFTGETK